MLDRHDDQTDTRCFDEECLASKRNNYFIGKRLSPASFGAEQAYQVGRRHLLNRAIHGWGVVYGFALSDVTPNQAISAASLSVGAGLALDAAGRELLLESARQLSLADMSVIDSNPNASCWVLQVHYAERRIGHINVRDACSCDRDEWDYTCETVWFSVRPCDPDKPNQCKTCLEKCGFHCECSDPCNETLERTDRGGCKCLCHAATRLDVDVTCKALTKVAKGVRADLEHGVTLGCVSLTRCPDGSFKFDRITDGCAGRRLVKRNDLLFDLIRGCDLTYIKAVTWGNWHRGIMPWDVFADFFQKPGDTEGVTQFRVEFSGPVQAETVTPGCFAIRVITFESRGCWGEVQYVPISGVQLERDPAHPERVFAAVLKVEPVWRSYVIFQDPFLCHHERARVEIEVRGDFIVDCCGQAIDGEVVGRRAASAGNGTPGGTLLTCFEVVLEDRRQTATQAHSQGPAYPAGQTQPYPPSQTQPYPPSQTQPYPPSQTQPYPPSQTQPYPAGQTQPYPPAQGQPPAQGYTPAPSAPVTHASPAAPVTPTNPATPAAPATAAPSVPAPPVPPTN